jgi:hypothetical protein
LIANTIEKHLANAPSSIWWVITYSITSIVDAVNVTFVMLQDTSLLLVQQEHRIIMLISTIMTMFSIEMIEEFKGGDNEGVGDYVNFEQWRINVDSIVAHIKDQGLFPQQCYKEVNIVNQEPVVKEIGMFVMELVISLQDIKVE